MRKQIEIRETNISLALDSYDDIFSDFDPRTYGTRALSHDFIEECVRAARDKPEEGMELRLIIPKKKRDTSTEKIVKKRLLEHFNKHNKRLQHERLQIRQAGLAWAAAGIILSLIAARMKIYDRGFLNILLFVITEPASWFSFWTGLDKIFLEPAKEKHRRQFYYKMSNADIKFESY